MKGEVEVRLDWADSRALLDAERVLVTLPDGKSELKALAGTRQTHKGLLVRLEGVVERNGAEALGGATLSVLRSELPPLEAGEYYLCDLDGLQVRGPEGALGRVIEVQMYPSVDTIVIETPTGQRFEQPLLPEWLTSVDVAGRTITLSSLDGLLEVDASPAADRGAAGGPQRREG